jgi:hypothetical protein
MSSEGIPERAASAVRASARTIVASLLPFAQPKMGTFRGTDQDFSQPSHTAV